MIDSTHLTHHLRWPGAAETVCNITGTSADTLRVDSETCAACRDIVPAVHFGDTVAGQLCGPARVAVPLTVVYKFVTCEACKRLLYAPGGLAHRQTQAPLACSPSEAIAAAVQVHYRTVGGPGPAACGVEVAASDLTRTSILDRVTCTACKKAAPGMKYDGEKARMSLLPFGALELVAQVMTYGARKYAPRNWLKLKNGRERAANAMLRHFTAWQSGERLDRESGLPHLAQMCCNGLFLLAFDEHTDGVKEEDIA